MLDCPWSGWAKQPTQFFCENPVCEWVESPSNAYSSVAYVLVGLYIIFHSRRAGTWHLAGIGASAILVAGGSFFFHASTTIVGGYIDFGSMYLFSSWALVSVARRALNTLELPDGQRRDLSMATGRIIFWAGVVLSVGAMVALGGHGSEIFVVHITLICGLELWVARRQAVRPPYRFLVWLVAMFGASQAAWWLDFARVGCDPEDHVWQAHAMWHVLSAPCFWFLYRFYAAEELRRAG